MDERILCEAVSTLRLEKGITAEEAAARIDAKLPSYSRYEETVGFTIQELSLLAKLLGVSLNYLLNGESTETPFGENSLKNSSVKDNKTELKDGTEEIIAQINMDLPPEDHVLFIDDYKKYL